MIWNPFKRYPKGFLGVDIGTFSIKIVEVSRAGKRRKLENYGEIRAASLYEKPFRTFDKSTLTVANKDVVRAITAVLKESGMKSKKAYFSIPDFSSFFTTFTLPAMTEQELPKAIEYEARQHIPLPLSEVTLDWQIIEGKTVNKEPTPFKILLLAVPNEIIQQYKDIAAEVKLELLSLEAEVFGLSRVLIKAPEKEMKVVLVDIGARSTTASIINKGVLVTSHSFDTSGNDLTNLITKGLSVDYAEAEQLKKEYGLTPSESSTRETMLPLIDLILSEIKKITSNFYVEEKKEIEKVIVAGGSALMPGLVNYFSKNLKKPVEIANPFSDIYYPPLLENILKKNGPNYAVAVGTALRGLE